jgi:ribonuclease D|tara:strand:+ start:72 stop:692 length:621 start_codon:yes stop_codon:yes gene_type:complete
MKIHKIQGDLTKEVAESFKISVSIDCEMQGLVPSRDKLSLITLTSDDENIYIIQPDRKTYKAPNLISVLENNKLMKIFHYARIDVHFLEFYLKAKVKNYWCTKLMSRLARTFSPNHGLKDLCESLCKVKLDKKVGSSTDWNKAEISDKEATYAANDVRYLRTIKEKLQLMLEREKRFDLFLITMKGLESRIALDKAGFQDPNIYEH